MIPSLEHVIKKRHHNRRRLRFMALTLVVIGMICVVWSVLNGLLVDHEWWPSLPLLSFAAGFIVPAIPLWLFDERIARALVPMPRWECPGCGYSLVALERPVCPECGLLLPAAFVRPRPAPDGSQHAASSATTADTDENE